MIDLRYLAVTVIAVFLALAVGLMTGSALGSPDRRDAAYEGLRNQFELLRAENQRVQDENDAVRRRLQARDDALREMLPHSIQGRLAGSRVAVVVCGGLDERPFWGELENAIRLSGAEVGPIVRVPDQLRELRSDVRARARAALAGPASAVSDDGFEPLAWLMRALAAGDGNQVSWLAQNLGVELRRGVSGPSRRVLVLVTVRDERRKAGVVSGEVPETRLISAAQAEGLRVVVAEPEEVLMSAVDPIRRRMQVPTVDNVDTPLGTLSTILTLAGANGHFGSKPGASRSLPSLQQP